MSEYATKVGDRVRRVESGWVRDLILGTVTKVSGAARPQVTVRWDGRKDEVVIRGRAADYIELARPGDAERVAAQRLASLLDQLAYEIQKIDRGPLVEKLMTEPAAIEVARGATALLRVVREIKP